MELWRDLLLDFMAEFTSGTPTTLVGNSIGGLASLMAAAAAPAGTVRGLVLLNTAGAMNNKAST
jgi:pimeloyl-ACP methyl ester carboxylesterase